MTLQHGKRTRQAIGLGIIAGVVLYMAGCSAMQPARALPPGVQGDVVGGGLRIEWIAPVKGTAYLIEATTNRIIETRSLDSGNSYSFAAPIEGQKNDFDRVLGVKLSEARFVLYFRPADARNPAR
jgi:hypothetical protein